ncbi:TatD family hydrolase [Deinococcus deserti]|uniref:Putative TatD deoxyribonuclease (Sec-independent protein translocase protein TatD) n=1 Tax=Deinococcus deserti (strain DSM 17065 / CIP 109153 / LMG 22923 / VCD115) TaxID=546414 RepID=C1CZK6_DEIDV|nr:TatD family hydrolase [Deinococcus deserti]ACO47254.1 putative TatD deoxyribonuclease (Sec-independent protein translocase protein TatD) [Deinococcus deserti VCD115]
MIDTHTHLDYLEDPASARGELGLSAMVCIGASLQHARNALDLADQFDDVYATVGLHPTETGEDSSQVRAELEKMALHPRVVGIGESGLDDYWDDTRRTEQLSAFEWQLDLARRLDKPLVIHTRDKADQDSAHQGVMDVLKAWPDVPVILHCFSGHAGMLRFGLERSAPTYFGFAGNVTYKNAPLIQQAAQNVPLDRLILETDAPFLSPVPRRGRPNRPGYVRYTLEFIAVLRELDPAELEQATDENARRVYRLRT